MSGQLVAQPRDVGFAMLPALDCSNSGSAAPPAQPCLQLQELSVPWRLSLLPGLGLLGCHPLLPGQEHPHLGRCSIGCGDGVFSGS